MRLYSKIYGDKSQDLIIIHGLFGMSNNWNSLGKKFAKYCRVHLIDLRNHGRSPHSKDFSYTVMADDVLQYMQEHRIQNPILLGHSLGGKIAMKIAFTYPSKLEKIIIADIAPRRYSVYLHENILRNISSIDLTVFKSRSEVENAVSLFVDDIGVRLFLLKNLCRNEQKEFSWRFNVKVLLEKISNIQEVCFIEGVCDIPTYFIKGEKSDYITISDEKLINKHFSKVSISTIEKTGHWLHAESPDRFYDEVIKFCFS